MKAVAILHYALPPTIGGVEATIRQHALALSELGYPVRLIGGQGTAFDPRIEVRLAPLFDSRHADVLAAKRALDAGQVPADFETLADRMMAALEDALADCAVCMAHNVLTLHKNLPLTAALARVHQRGRLHLIAWCHDLAWTNPQYQPEMYRGLPWGLLRQAWADVQYVAVSEPRRAELAALLDLPMTAVRTVVPGVDLAAFLNWTPLTVRLVTALDWLDADGLLLLPARITRRKNIELALRILAEVRDQSGADYRLIVSGPPGPHNPANQGYLAELLDLRRMLGLEASAHFLYTCGEDGGALIPDDATVANLYHLADALLFPSVQEGFGMPLVEAGLARLPVICADIPPLRETGQADVTYFDPHHDSPAAIATVLLASLQANAAARLRRRVRRQYRWQAIVREQIVPLVEGASQ